jgi:hypothetical protein
MRQASKRVPDSAEKTVRDIRSSGRCWQYGTCLSTAKEEL